MEASIWLRRQMPGTTKVKSQNVYPIHSCGGTHNTFLKLQGNQGINRGVIVHFKAC